MKRTRLVQRPVHRRGETPRWVLTTETVDVDPFLRLRQIRQRIEQRLSRLEAAYREHRP